MVYIVLFYTQISNKRLFGVFSTKEEAEKCRDYLAERLKEEGWSVFTKRKGFKFIIMEEKVIESWNEKDFGLN